MCKIPWLGKEVVDQGLIGIDAFNLNQKRRKTMAKLFAFLSVLILAILTVPQANGQGKGGKMGMGVLLSPPASGYNFKYWLSSRSALELGGTFYQVKPKHGGATTE